MEELIKVAEKLVEEARAKKTFIALAESCTGGMVAMAITSIPGSSEVFGRGYVTYSYEAKSGVLGVSFETLQKHGAVSPECVEQMVFGAIKHSRAHVAVSVSGIAGPGGGTPDKPIGLVYFGFYDRKNQKLGTEKAMFSGNRYDIRVQSSIRAIEILRRLVAENSNNDEIPITGS